jgi:signal transduction histidine kinase
MSRVFKSLRFRLIASYLLVILLVMGVAAGLVWSALDRAFLDVLCENLLAQAQRVAQTVQADEAGELTPVDVSAAQAADVSGGNEPVTSTMDVAQGASEVAPTGELTQTTGETTYAYVAPSNNWIQFAEEDASQFADLTYGYQARVIDDEGVIILNPLVGFNTPAISVTSAIAASAVESRVYDAPYSQAANVTPGYHTHIISSDGTVVVSPDTGDTNTADEIPVLSSLDRYRKFASNYAPYPADEREQSGSADLLNRSEVQSALAGEPATLVRTYDWAPERRVLYAAYPVRSSAGSVTSVVYVASPLPRLSLSLLPTYFGPQVLGGASLAVLVAGLAGLILARVLMRPLSQLTEAASTLAQGEPAPPIPLASTTELNRLGEAFNTMNASLTAAHEELAAQAQQREAILENLADAVLAANAAGEIILANPAASALLRAAPEPLRRAIQHTLACEEPHGTEVALRDQVVELLTTPLRDEEGRISGAVAVGHDVTAYRQLDRLRTNFVSDVSHELRTPLTAIKGFIETLQDGAADDPEARDRFLQTIAAETERLTRLTNDLLLLTRADAGRLELRLVPTDLFAAASRAVAQLDRQARERRVTITIEPADTPSVVRADEDRIHQVLVNLLDNGIKFTPAKGQVSISFGQADEQVSCTIADTGPGIPAGEIPHVFERFYRGDRARARVAGENGSGLGLAIARAIVEAHGGRIWVESEPGQGARFTFALPSAL